MNSLYEKLSTVITDLFKKNDKLSLLNYASMI